MRSRLSDVLDAFADALHDCWLAFSYSFIAILVVAAWLGDSLLRIQNALYVGLSILMKMSEASINTRGLVLVVFFLLLGAWETATLRWPGCNRCQQLRAVVWAAWSGGMTTWIIRVHMPSAWYSVLFVFAILLGLILVAENIIDVLYAKRLSGIPAKI